MNENRARVKSTTVIAIRKNGVVVMGADGQATLGHTVIKSTVKKLRTLADGKIIAGFAGSTADAFTLLDRFEAKLNAHAGNMFRAAVGLAKAWRMDKYLRALEAVMLVADKEQTLMISGTGDVMKPDHDIVAIGSGGTYAHAAALALKNYAPNLTAVEMVKASMRIAGDICIYTNHNLTMQSIGVPKKASKSK